MTAKPNAGKAEGGAAPHAPAIWLLNGIREGTPYEDPGATETIAAYSTERAALAEAERLNTIRAERKCWCDSDAMGPMPDRLQEANYDEYGVEEMELSGIAPQAPPASPALEPLSAEELELKLRMRETDVAALNAACREGQNREKTLAAALLTARQAIIDQCRGDYIPTDLINNLCNRIDRALAAGEKP